MWRHFWRGNHINGQEIARVQGKGDLAYSFDFTIGGYPAGAYTLHLLTEGDRKIVRKTMNIATKGA